MNSDDFKPINQYIKPPAVYRPAPADAPVLNPSLPAGFTLDPELRAIIRNPPTPIQRTGDRTADFAQLSSDTYDVDKHHVGEMVGNWKIIDIGRNESKAFGAITYQNDVTKEIVVGFRGTMPPSSLEGARDWANNIKLAGSTGVPEEVKMGQQMVNNAFYSAPEGYKVMTTGHSQGGMIAHYTAKTLDIPSVGFNSAPGTEHMNSVSYFPGGTAPHLDFISSEKGRPGIPFVTQDGVNSVDQVQSIAIPGTHGLLKVDTNIRPIDGVQKIYLPTGCEDKVCHSIDNFSKDNINKIVGDQDKAILSDTQLEKAKLFELPPPEKNSTSIFDGPAQSPKDSPFPWENPSTLPTNPLSAPATMSNQGVQASYSPANESPVMSPAAYSKLSGSETPVSTPMTGELGTYSAPQSVPMGGEFGMSSIPMPRRSDNNSNPLNITDTEGSSIGAHLGLADDMKLGKPFPNGDGSYNYPILDSKGNPIGSFDIHRQDDGDLVLHGAHQSNHLQGSAGWDRPNASSGHSTGTGTEKDFNTGKTEKSDGGFDGAGASFGGKAEGSANAFEVQTYDMIIEPDGSGLMDKITSSFGKGSASIKGGGNAGVDGKGKPDANIGVQAGAEGKAAEGTLGGEKFFSMQVSPDGMCKQTTIGAEGGAFLGGAAKYTGSLGNQGFQSKGSLGLGAGLTGGGKFEYGKTDQCNNPFSQIGQPPAGSQGSSGSDSISGDNPLPFGFSPDGLTPGPMSFGGSGMTGGGQSIKAIEDEADDLSGQADEHADHAESAARRARSAARRAASIAARIRAMTSRRYS